MVDYRRNLYSRRKPRGNDARGYEKDKGQCITDTLSGHGQFLAIRPDGVLFTHASAYLYIITLSFYLLAVSDFSPSFAAKNVEARTKLAGQRDGNQKSISSLTATPGTPHQRTGEESHLYVTLNEANRMSYISAVFNSAMTSSPVRNGW